MKKNFTLALLFVSVIFFAGCKNNRDEKVSKIESQFKTCLQEVKKSDKIEAPVYMIIPRAGCSGCISGAESFMLSSIKDNQNKNLIRFVLTDFDSEKTLRARFGNVASNEMIIVDKENKFLSNQSLKSIYPVVLFFDNTNHLANVTEVSPSKDGLGETHRFIAALKNDLHKNEAN